MSIIEESLDAKMTGLLEQFPGYEPDFIRSVASADPTGCRYVGFMLRTLHEKQWDTLDILNLRGILESYQVMSRDSSWQGQRDINAYTLVAEIVEDINRHVSLPVAPIIEQIEGATKIASSGNLEVWQASTPEAAALLSRGKGGVENPSTDWPTKSTKLAAKYLVGGPLYIVTKDGESYALVHFARHEAKDAHNLNLSSATAGEIAPLFYGQSFASELGSIPYAPGGWQLDDGDIEEYLKKLRSKFINQRRHGFYKGETWIEPVDDLKLLERRWKAKEPEFRKTLKLAQSHHDLDVIMKAGRKHPDPTGLQALANAVYDLEHA